MTSQDYNKTEEATNYDNINGTLDQRRQESRQATEQIAQETARRISELTCTQLDAWQKQLEIGTQMAKFWVDTMNTNQQAFNQITQHMQNLQKRNTA